MTPRRPAARGRSIRRGESLYAQVVLTVVALALVGLVAIRWMGRPWAGAGGVGTGPVGRVVGPAIPWEEAERRVGQVVTFEGRIVAAKNTGKICFLNFHEDWRSHLAVVIFPVDFDRFPDGKPEVHFQGRRVRVTGKVETYQGRPEVKIRDASQIEVIP